jgi:SAM-dependent methyltransferase
MDERTIWRLNDLNRQFYATVAHSFDQTRGSAWHGWERLLPYLRDLPASPRVLDVGCGNGRFGLFLAQNNILAHYTGHDNNATLLAHAQHDLQGANLASFQLVERDSILNPLEEGAYDFIGVFGVVHHVPSLERRKAFLRGLGERLTNKGILAYATWRFMDDDKLRQRVVAWDDDLAPQVEEHDYLLDWRQGDRALRYCHYVDDAEQAQLDDATGLHLLEHYRADGKDGRLNGYSILRRSEGRVPRSE